MVTVAGIEYDVPTIQEIVAEYAWDEREFAVARRNGILDRAEDCQVRKRAVFGYRTYDCVPASEGSAITELDVFVLSGLNAQLNVQRVAVLLELRGALSQVIEELDDIDSNTPGGIHFWTLPTEEIATPKKGTVGWLLLKAWALLVGAPDVGVAIAHKLLHHKRPHLFPLVDGRTVKCFPEGKAWETIHGELVTSARDWTLLEEWFAEEAKRRGTVRLTRLRMHDIVTWRAAMDRPQLSDALTLAFDS